MINVEAFIQAVKDRPALYNPVHPLYLRKELRKRLWNEVGRIVYSDWDKVDAENRSAKASFMQKKWKCLKNCFNREARYQQLDRPTSSRKKYEYYEQLSFLQLKKKANQPRSNIAERRARLRLGAKRQRMIMNKKRKTLRRELEESEDCDALFLMSLIDDLKRLPLASKYWVKMKFTETILEAATRASRVRAAGGEDVQQESDSYDYESDDSAEFYQFHFTKQDPYD